jgi:uncharacterized protein (DUF1330 family)
MRIKYAVALSLLAGVTIGAAAVQGLHAQAKPPVYIVSEITIDDGKLDTYMKEYAPLAQAAIKAAGGSLVAAGQATEVEGPAPKARITINEFKSIEDAKASRTSAAYKKARETGDKLAKFHAYLITGAPQ